MHKSLLKLDAYHKYREQIIAKNTWGLTYNSISFFLTLIAVLLTCKVRGQAYIGVHAFFLVALTIFIIGMILLNKSNRYLMLSCILNYMLGYGFCGHICYLYSNELPLVLFAYFSLSLCIALTVHPAVFLSMNVTGTMIFTLAFYASNGGMISMMEAFFIVNVFLVSNLFGLTFWVLRIQNIAFKNEITDFMTGSASTRPGSFVVTVNYRSGKLISVLGDNRFGLSVGMDATDAIDNVIQYVNDPKSKQTVRAFLNPKNLLNKYKHGIMYTEEGAMFSFPDGEWIWYDVETNLQIDPSTGDPITVFTVSEANESHLRTELLNYLIVNNYDYVMALERGKSCPVIYRVRDNEAIQGISIGDYDMEMSTYVSEVVAEYDKARVLKETMLPSIYEALAHAESYEFLVDEIHVGMEKVLKKRFIYYYLNGDKRFLIVLKQDVTDVLNREAEARRKLSDALERAEAATKSKTEFLSRVSHEMRTPMNAIMGLSSLMEDDIKNPEQLMDYVRKIRSSSEYLLRLINDVLDMSKLELRKSGLTLDEYNFGEFYQTIDTMIRPMCRDKGIKYIDATNVSKGTTIRADRLKVTQIVINLLTNAVKYTPSGGVIEYTVEEISRDSGSINVRFMVRDNGIGISEAFMEKMFEPFSQEEADNRNSLNGTGLGLSIVKGLVDLLGGTIHATSKKGEGSTFVVELAFKLVEVSTAVRKETITVEELSGKRVLVVEDNDINREIATAILKKKGVLVEEAVDGMEAVEKFRFSKPGYFDAILMDIRMPKLNGIDATKNIRAMARGDAANIPIVAMTANAFTDDVNLSKSSGMNAHLSKPIEPNLLYETLASFIQKPV